jgi:hypothetical protein
MTPMLEAYRFLVILYWVAMVPIAVYVLYLVAGYFTGEPPSSFRRALLTVLFVAAAVFFTYDASGYLFVRMMEDSGAGFQLPAGYTYWNWLAEPMALKWYVLGYVPIIRYLPVVFALCMGGILFVLIWQVPWRIAAVLFLAQLVLDVVAMVVLSFVLRLGLNLYEWVVSAPPGAAPNYAQVEEAPAPRTPPPSLPHLYGRVQHIPPGQGPWWRRLNADWEGFNQHLKPVYDFLQPVTRHFPPPAQDFLNGGGWPLVLVGLVVLGLCWPRVHRKRTEYVHHKRHHHPAHRRERLSLIGDALTGLGPTQVTVRGVPARLRLVVLAPATPETGAPPKEEAPAVLDALRAGLGAVAGYDVPRVDVWKHLHGNEGFRQAFETAVELPEPKDQPSRWVLVVGTAPHGQGTLHVGLGLHANAVTAVRVTEVAPGGWAEVLDLRTVPVDERDE